MVPLLVYDEVSVQKSTNHVTPFIDIIVLSLRLSQSTAKTHL